MRAWYSGFTSSAVAALSLSACVSAIPVPDTADGLWAQSRWEDTTVASLSRGRALYVARCSSCHSLHVPATISATRWPTLIEEMTRRANLRPDERVLILRYLITAGRAGPDGGRRGTQS